ncbi:SNF2 family N-terminal domain-containing protein [Flagelloscypha sp. PMI_526]|nr:SNF2 family N-terminal domain-containing protein [Flagelloscypha sp. PMI_526]
MSLSVSYHVGYTKAATARCNGPAPCKGTFMPKGTLRIGRAIKDEYTETVEWRHWGCATMDWLRGIKINQLEGLNMLTPNDQGKIPGSAHAKMPPPSVASSSRTAALAVPSWAPPSASQRVRQHAALIGMDEIDDDIQTSSEEPQDEMLLQFNGRIVGIRYYRGMVGEGEQVRLVREPSNPYDRNAIQVKNIGNVQVGHLAKNFAAALAPLMDQQVATVEGVVNAGNLRGGNHYELPLTLIIYGPPTNRSRVEQSLRAFAPRKTTSASASSRTAIGGSSGYGSAYGGGYGGMPMTAPFQTARAHKLTPAQEAAVKSQWEEIAKANELRTIVAGLERLLDKLCEVEDILSLPIHPNPPVDLLKHQAQALAWALEKEYPKLPVTEADKPVQFWQVKKNGAQPYYYNIATKTPQAKAPELGRGALNADAMGLGKTLTMISVILATLKDKPARGFSNATLIVCPLSILSNWEKQIQDHVVEGQLKYCIYHGTGRNLSTSDVSKYDVIVTTFQTVAGEINEPAQGEPSTKKKKMENTLFTTKWKRIILDEGHVIRNPKTKMAKACCGMTAERRWVLTGTPIINSPRDLGSILTFLKICAPLDNEDFFKRLVLRPLKDANPDGAQLLSGIMSSICIRRTKEMQDKNGNPLVPLPPVEQIVVPVTLSAEARDLYDQVEEISGQRVESLLRHSAPVHSNVLSMLTRLRQIALHPGLVPANYLQTLRSESDEDNDEGLVNQSTAPLTPEERSRLQNKLAQAIEDLEECPICFGQMNMPRITICGHSFCLQCITEVIHRDPRCPMDRRPLAILDLIEPQPLSEMMLTQPQYRDESEDEPPALAEASSAKIDQLVQMLRLNPATEKSLVFSQFTSFLDKIEEELRKQNIPFVRFDGKMSARRRQETLNRFSVPITEANAREPTSSQPNTTNVGASTPVSDPEPVITSRRGRKARASVILDSDDFIDGTDDDDDFVMNEAGHSDNDLNFEDSPPKKSRKNKGKQRASAPQPLDDDDDDILSALPSIDTSENPQVMLISLKAGALGLNLTVANNVYLMDPWWQEGIESQAIDRVNRIGQKKDVHVYQLIAENTVESKVLAIQERKKKLVNEAFSGIKRTETQRTQKEARLQDLIELFGIRKQGLTQKTLD